MTREAMTYDVVIVGAGPAGLAAAIRLRQLSAASAREVSVCVIEKGAEVGAHILSGAVIEPRALDELLPDWRQRETPIRTAAGTDRLVYLTAKHALPLPTPPQMHNRGNFIVSLGDVCRWLGREAEALGVEIYSGFAAAEVLYDDAGAVVGVATGDMGITKSGDKGPNYQPGVELRARQTLFAEGCRGSLTRGLFARFGLEGGREPQTYGIGLKELWEIDPAKHQSGLVMHSIGWPLDWRTYGGSFIYHLDPNLVAIGFVVGLDYRNPYLNPYEEFQRFKHHPSVRPMLAGGRRIGYGARALNEGGFQSIPKLTFPGGALIGCAAGFMNVPKIKGSHTAMKSGMVAAEAVHAALTQPAPAREIASYETRLRQSWVWDELRRVRNVRPAFRYGLPLALAYNAVDSYLLRGRAPWTLRHHRDHEALLPKDRVRPITYPKPDGVISFDRLTSVAFANTNHEEDQPSHLTLTDPTVPVAVNLARYDAPEQRYCPAGVYEILRDADGANPRLQINAQNCVHCKTCDIKDPTQNIVWVVPQGGGGPNYSGM